MPDLALILGAVLSGCLLEKGVKSLLRFHGYP